MKVFKALAAAAVLAVALSGSYITQAGSGGGGPRFFYGVCQAGAVSWPVSLPVANAPSYNACDAVHQTGVMQVANNTANELFWVIAPVVTANPKVAMVFAGRSADSTHATTVTPSYTCVGAVAVDNPLASAVGLTPVTLTAGAASIRTTAASTQTVTCSGTASSPARLYLFLLTDTTALTGGATFDWIDLTISF